jgi:hypothetical protein
MKTSGLAEMQKRLRSGKVYRRQDLAQWSASVDRHLKTLVATGDLKKLRHDMYYCPKNLAFGEAPASEHELVRAFLKTNHFVVTSPNLYNQLGLGTTQLYNKRVVYNQKRHGTFDLGGRVYHFERRMNVPRKLSKELLLVDLVNEVDELAEDRDVLLARVRENASHMDSRKLSRVVSLYANYSSRRWWKSLGYA